jgi:hypothetical protein
MGRGLKAATHRLSILLSSYLSTMLSPCERFLCALLLYGIQGRGVALHIREEVCWLHMARETAQRNLKDLTLLKSDVRQLSEPPNPSRRTG